MPIDTPATEAIKYTGSKLRLLPHILSLSKKAETAEGMACGAAVFDGFSGSGRVSQAYAKKEYRVYANDIAIYSKFFNTAYLLNKKEPRAYRPLIDHLNSLAPLDGWFTEHYGGEENSNTVKFPWQKKNTRKLDAIREEIDRLNLDEVTKAVAVTSLILALDQVDSTMGHYVSYLNGWSPRSYKELKLSTPKLWVNQQDNVVMNEDIFSAVSRLPDGIDIAYLDPPYGSNNEKMPPSRVRYASYYHIWTTICLNDKPEIFGKARRRADTSDLIAASVFEEFRRSPSGRFMVIEAIEKLIREIRAKYIILSYSSGGRATAEDLNEVLNTCGEIIEIEKIDYKKNVMAGMKWTNDWIKDTEEKNFEFLFLVKKG
ncbi:restriction endonuclease subunit M [Spirochaetia bacterium]|nr:restriction endonuclease subunit M [Spirochaetia bacterium]